MWDTVSGARILSYSLLFLLGKPLGFNYFVHFWPGGKLSTWHQSGFGSNLSLDWVTNLKKPNKTASSQTLWTNVTAQDFSLHFASTWCVFSWKHQSSQHCSIASYWPLTIMLNYGLRINCLHHSVHTSASEVAQEGRWMHVPVAWWNDETNQISYLLPLPGE